MNRLIFTFAMVFAVAACGDDYDELAGYYTGSYLMQDSTDRWWRQHPGTAEVVVEQNGRLLNGRVDFAGTGIRVWKDSERRDTFDFAYGYEFDGSVTEGRDPIVAIELVSCTSGRWIVAGTHTTRTGSMTLRSDQGCGLEFHVEIDVSKRAAP